MHSSSTKAFEQPAGTFDPRRLRGVLVVAFGGAALLAAMHFVLGFAFGRDAAAIHPRQRPLGWPLHERVWRRMAAIDHLHHSGQLSSDTRLGVFIGVSTTATGIQRRFLDARANLADHWIVLAGAGLSFENIESVMLPVFFSSLKPSAVVFGIHPQMLVGERYIGDEPTIGPQQVVGRRRRALESRIGGIPAFSWVQKYWPVRNRVLAGNFLRSYVYAFRLGLFYMLGITADELFEPVPEPWDEEPLWLWNMDDVDNQFANDQMEFWSRRGHFKAANYDPDGDQARSLVRMIRAYRRIGAKVYIVVLPLRSTLRRVVPDNAKPCLLEVLNREFPESPPKVIDLEEAMPDQLFTDEAHLSKSGADRLSRMVAERLRTTDDEEQAGEEPAAESP